MHYLEQFQLNVFAIMMLVILLVVISKRMRVQTYGKKLLYTVIIVTMGAIITEPLTWMFDGTHFVGSYFLEYITNVMLILFGPIIGCLMLSYVNYYLLQRHTPILVQLLRFVPFWITVVMLIINLFTPIYFRIGSMNNTYQAGAYLGLHYIMLVLIYLYMIFLTIKYGKKHNTKAILIFAVFFFLPIAGMAIQIINPYINFSWNFIVLSILVIFLFLEAADGELDFLTGLFNRRSYENYVQRLIERNRAFQVIYIDLDKFKQINDDYGHLAGDKVLIEFGTLLRSIFQKTALLARLGGDEYMIVVECKIDMEATILKITEAIAAGSDQIKHINFSYGVQKYDPGMSVDELYAAVDAKMYQYKRANNNLRRRRSDD